MAGVLSCVVDCGGRFWLSKYRRSRSVVFRPVAGMVRDALVE